MKITILTLFPEMFKGPFDISIIKKARGKKLVEILLINIRDFGIGSHNVVDDRPYGGGLGMILRIDVLFNALKSVKDKKLSNKKQKIFLMDARGDLFTQKKALELSTLEHLILICGHYEGVDERINKYIDGKISVGPYVVTGGEIPSMLITDAVVRLTKGVLKKGVVTTESHSDPKHNFSSLEYPHYTRPETYDGETVPEVLISGDHKKIEVWKEEHTKRT